MNRTKVTARAFAVSVSKTTVIGTFLVLSLIGVYYAFSLMGSAWGLLSVLFFSILSIWTYTKNLKNVKGAKDAIDGFIASILQFCFVGIVALPVLYIAESVRSITSGIVGWLVFASLLCFAGLFYVRFISMYSEHD